MKYLKIIVVPLLLVVFSLSLPSCSVNPVTGKKEFSIWSDQDEINYGSQNYQPAIQQLNGAYQNEQVQAYVNRVGLKLAKSSHRPQMPYEFTVVNTSMINAFAVPGGKITLTRGLLSRFTNESQLAAVLGHEVGHIAARHSANQVSKQLLIGSILVPTADLLLSRQSEHYRQYRSLYTTAAVIGFQMGMLAYSRSQESQSDGLGMEYMTKAGYHPQGMVELMQIFQGESKSKPSLVEELFSTHPMSSKRVETAEAALNTQYAQAIKTRNLARTSREFTEVAQVMKKEAPAYAKYDEATEAAGRGAWYQAIPLYQTALQLKPAEPLFYADLGYAYAMTNQDTLAEENFRRASAVYPQFFKPKFYMGQLKYYQRNYSQSISYLTEADRLIPGAPLVRLMIGEGYESLGDSQTAARYYADVSKRDTQGGLGSRARSHLQRLGFIQQ